MGKRRHDDVLRAAAKVFHSRGYAEATVQDVASELGILKGSLYYYIKTKEDLLFGVMDKAHDEVDQILADVLNLTGLTSLELLREYVTRMVAHTMRNLEALSVYYHDIDRLGEPHRSEIYARRRVHEDFVTDLLSQAQALGDVDGEHQPRLLSKQVFASIIWVYRWYRPTGPVPTDAAIATCVAYVFNGLTAPVAEAPPPAAPPALPAS